VHTILVYSHLTHSQASIAVLLLAALFDIIISAVAEDKLASANNYCL
jgi:hypothetical protein